MRRMSVLLVALVLVPAASADAKFSAARVCGRIDCRQVSFAAGHQLLALERVAFSAESRLGAKPPHASPWYRVTLCPGRCDSRRALALKVLRSTGYAYLPPREWDHVIGDTYPPRKGWAKMGEHGADAYRSVTRGLGPFPASRLLRLGAEPGSGPAEEPGSGTSSHGGIPAWGWVAIIAAATLALLSLRLRSAWRRSPSAR
jgi:hypothetical protein